jgi:hypothetical protein
MLVHLSHVRSLHARTIARWMSALCISTRLSLYGEALHGGSTGTPTKAGPQPEHLKHWGARFPGNEPALAGRGADRVVCGRCKLAGAWKMKLPAWSCGRRGGPGSPASPAAPPAYHSLPCGRLLTCSRRSFRHSPFPRRALRYQRDSRHLSYLSLLSTSLPLSSSISSTSHLFGYSCILFGYLTSSLPPAVQIAVPSI